MISKVSDVLDYLHDKAYGLLQHELHIFSKLLRNSRGHGKASMPAGPGDPGLPRNPRRPSRPSSP